MDTQNLKAFYATAQERSFSKAAQNLYITQPAISKRVANLEDFLGCKLFNRIGRKISLTQAGNVLMPKVANILRELEGMHSLLKDLDEGINGFINIATSHHIGRHRLPPFIKKFMLNYPQAELDINFLESDKIYSEILEGNYDLAIATLSLSLPPQIETIPLWQDELCIMVSNTHSLSDKESVNLADLNKVASILPNYVTSTYQCVKNIFEQHKAPLIINKIVNNLDSIKVLLEAGIGWGVLPKNMKSDELHIIEIDNIKFIRTLGILYHKNKVSNKVANAFMNVLKESG